MIKQQALPGGYVVFCDDHRTEANGKQMFIGVYGAAMIVNRPAPITLPQLIAMAVLRVDPSTLPKNVVIRVTKETASSEDLIAQLEFEMPAGPIPEGPFNSRDAEQQAYAEARLPLSLAPFTVEEDLRLKVRAYIDDDEIRLGTLLVTTNATPAGPTMFESIPMGEMPGVAEPQAGV